MELGGELATCQRPARGRRLDRFGFSRTIAYHARFRCAKTARNDESYRGVKGARAGLRFAEDLPQRWISTQQRLAGITRVEGDSIIC